LTRHIRGEVDACELVHFCKHIGGHVEHLLLVVFNE
jgi:hypothetical protein